MKRNRSKTKRVEISHIKQAVVEMALLACLLAYPGTVHAMPPSQADPATQCREGRLLVYNGQITKARSLLEAGFAGREGTTFVNPDDLGQCALVLGQLRSQTGDQDGALEAFAVALEVFQDSGNRRSEGVTLNNIGEVYRAQEHYAEALGAYEQSLAIRLEVDDRAGQGTVLNNIGLAYEAEGRYTEALDVLQQALGIIREIEDRTREAVTLAKCH